MKTIYSNNPIPKRGVWIYKICEDLSFETPLTGHQFDSEWLKVDPDGTLAVKGSNKDGYCWDGCTPKFEFLDLIWGTPDGKIDRETGKPITYHASLVHDALYQYLHEVPYSKKDIDLLFLEMLGDFKLRYLYFYAVCLFGGRFIKQKNI